MPKKSEPTAEQRADAARLKALYQAKSRGLGLTQELIADELGITQGGVSHYLNGKNALNTKVAATFARLLKVSVGEFSPSLESQIKNQYRYPDDPKAADLLNLIEGFSDDQLDQLKEIARIIGKSKSPDL